MGDFESWRARDRTQECSTSAGGISDTLFEAKLSGKTQLSSIERDWLATSLVKLLREEEFPCKRWQKYDKAFACAWLTSQQVAVGTKCNKLLLLNADHKRNPHIPLVQNVTLPPAPPRPRSPPPAPHLPLFSNVQDALWTIRAQMAGQNGSSRASSAAEDQDDMAGMLARAVAALDERYGGPIFPAEAASAEAGVQMANCGIHSISCSPCGSLLASGGSDPCDCQVFRVEQQPDGSSALIPAQTLVGHKDWLFGSAWVTDRHIVTGSRDMCLKLWSVDPLSSRPNRKPLRTCAQQSSKIREVKFVEQQQRVVSLSVEGAVTFWDAHLDSISTVKLPHEREVVCMACSENTLVAAGSQNHATLLDVRQPGIAGSVPNADLNHSVRSLAFSRSLLSIGGGKGKINFYDLRAGRFFDPAAALEPDWRSGREMHRLQTGSGYLARNQVYMDHFSGAEVRNACYAHSWDPDSTRLLAVGGPLAFGLTGCYMGIWR